MQNRFGGRKTGKPVTPARNIRLILAFDGTRYHGWQAQANQSTIQGILSRTIEQISGEQAKLVGSGRTDAGTHARRLVANFMSRARMTPASWVRALNSTLPPDIRILSARRVPASFHARHDARSKVYRYQIFRGAVLPPHLAREHYHYPYPIDVPTMQKVARQFVGEHDFGSFTPCKVADSKPTVRRICRCELKAKGKRLLLTV